VVTTLALLAAFLGIVAIGCTLVLVHDWIDRRLE
jgi:hypothetical protein